MRHAGRAIALALALAAIAAAAHAMDVRTGEYVLVDGAADDVVFASGEEVKISVQAQDDVFAAGGDISVAQASAQHLFLAGGDVTLLNTNATDVIAAGGEIDINGGEISDDLIVAGGRIVLGDQARITGSVVLAGGALRIDAPVGAGLRAAGRSIRLNSAVDGNVYLTGDSIVIGPNARIAGDLIHRGRSVEIDAGAQIAGQVTVLEPRPRPSGRAFAAFAGAAFIAVLVGLVLMAAVAALVAPRVMNEAAARVRATPWLMLGVGAAASIIAPVAIALLAFTLIGLPLAFLMGVLMVALWPLAVAAAAYVLGVWGRARLRKQDAPPGAGARFLWVGAGMVVLVLVGLIPFIGGLIWLVAYWLGLGALITQLRGASSATPERA